MMEHWQLIGTAIALGGVLAFIQWQISVLADAVKMLLEHEIKQKKVDR